MKVGFELAVDLSELEPRKALIKAMLNSPTADASDTCNLFTQSELTSLKNREPKVVSRILEAAGCL